MKIKIVSIFLIVFLIICYSVFSVSLTSVTLTSNTYNTTRGNLTCGYSASSDTKTSAISWYKNNTPTMLLYLPFEGNSTNAVKDYSGFGTNGSTSAIWNTSLGYNNSGSFNFNGYNDYVNMGNNSRFNLYTNFTIMFWLKLNYDNASRFPNPTYYRYVSTKNDYNSVTGWDISGALRENIISFTGENTAQGNIQNFYMVQNFNWSRYHHFAMIMRNTTGGKVNVTLYVDGIFFASGTTANSIQNSNLNLTIGRFAVQPRDYLNGTIDELRIYNYSITPQRILQIYNNRTDLILSNEISVGDVWNCRVTAFNSTAQSSTLQSNNLTIREYNNNVVAITYPINNYHYLDFTGNITYTNTEPSTCIINDTRFVNSTSVTNSMRGTFTNSTIESIDQRVNLRINCTDIIGNKSSTIVSFVIDNIEPFLNFLKPTDAVTYTKSENPFNVTFYSYDVYLDVINFTFRNSSNQIRYNNQTNYTTINNITLTYFVPLSEGNNSVEVCERDSLQNSPVIQDKTIDFQVTSQATISAIAEKSKDVKVDYDYVKENVHFFSVKGVQFVRSITQYDKSGNIKPSLSRFSNDWDLSAKHLKTTWDLTKDEIGDYTIIKYECLHNCEYFRVLTDRGRDRIIDNRGTAYFTFDDIVNMGFVVKLYTEKNTAYARVDYKDEEQFIKLNSVERIDPIMGGLNSVCQNRTIVYDTTFPRVSYVSDIGTLNKSSISLNFTASDINYNSTIVRLYSSSGVLLSSQTYLTTNANHLFTNLNDGVYYFNVSTSDLAGNYNNSVTSNVLIEHQPPQIIFNNQKPSDLIVLSIPQSQINITYDITDFSGIDNSSVLIYYKTNGTTSDIRYYVNGTSYFGFSSKSYSSISSNSYLFRLFDNQILTGTYNYDEDYLENIPQSTGVLTKSSQMLSVELLNVSNTNEFGFFEIMANQTTPIANMQMFYCNSSYTFTNNPASNTNCVLFYTIITNTFDHRHTQYSSHAVVPFFVNTTKGTLLNVKVTPKSYFIIKSPTGNDITYYYITNTTRAGVSRITNNNGNTWTNQTFTLNAHLHQYNLGYSLYYYACASDTYYHNNCSSQIKEPFVLGELPPFSPIVYSPINDTYYVEREIIDINYTSAVSPNGYPIIYNNITLLDENLTFYDVISYNNSNNLYYSWNISAFTNYGDYIILVTSCDNNSLCSSGTSDLFTITDDEVSPIVTFVNPTPVNMNETRNDVVINVTNYDEIKINGNCYAQIDGINYSMTLYPIDFNNNYCEYSFTNTALNITELHEYKVFSNDSKNNFGVSETRYVTIDNLIPTFIGISDNSAFVNDTGNVTFSVTSVNDNGSVYINIDGTDYFTDGSSYDKSLNYGFHTYKWYSWSNTLHQNYGESATYTIFINTISINNTIYNLTYNQSILSEYSYNFSYSCNDLYGFGRNATFEILNPDLSVNASATNLSFYGINQVTANIFSQMSRGQYYANLICYDNLTSKNYTIPFMLVENDKSTIGKLNYVLIGQNNQIIDWNISVLSGLLQNANVTIYQPNGSVYDFIQIPADYNYNVSSVTYNNSVLSNIERGNWFAQLQIIGSFYQHNTTFKSLFNFSEFIEEKYCDAMTIGLSISTPKYCSVNESCNIVVTTNPTLPNYENASLLVLYQNVTYQVSATGNQFEFSFSSTIEEDATFRMQGIFYNQTTLLCSVNQTNTAKFRTPFYVDVHLYVMDFLNNSRSYVNNFDYIYLLYTNMTTGTIISIDNTIDTMQITTDILKSINKKVLNLDYSAYDDGKTYFWSPYINGKARIKLYERGGYDLYIINSNVHLNTTYPEFSKPVIANGLKYDSQLYKGLNLTHNEVFQLKTTPFNTNPLDILRKMGLTLLILVLLVVIHIIIFAIGEKLTMGFGGHISGLIAVITIPITILLLLITWI